MGDGGCHTLVVPLNVRGGYRKDSLDFRSEYDGGKADSEAATLVFKFPAQGNNPALTVC